MMLLVEMWLHILSINMGTGGSFLHNPEDDDILGKDLDGSSRGVIKRIPIEIRPDTKYRFNWYEMYYEGTGILKLRSNNTKANA
jgi:hypothetical protein